MVERKIGRGINKAFIDRIHVNILRTDVNVNEQEDEEVMFHLQDIILGDKNE